MIDQRTEALTSRFTVSSTWEQPESWQTDGLIPTEMPPGVFVLLEPPLHDAEPGHFLVGLDAMIVNESGVSSPLPHIMWRLDEIGHIILFCDKESGCSPPIGTSVRFIE